MDLVKAIPSKVAKAEAATKEKIAEKNDKVPVTVLTGFLGSGYLAFFVGECNGAGRGKYNQAEVNECDVLASWQDWETFAFCVNDAEPLV